MNIQSINIAHVAEIVKRSWHGQRADMRLWAPLIQIWLQEHAKRSAALTPPSLAIVLLSSVIQSPTALAIDTFGSFRDFHEFITTSRAGYYGGNRATIGSSGADFTTNPCLFSPYFGRLLAYQIHEIFSAMLEAGDITADDTPFHIYEIGPGTGQMAYDIMEIIYIQKTRGGTWNLLWKKLRYCLVEASSDLAAEQKQRLAVFPSHKYETHIGTIQDYQSGPTTTGVCICNELHDDLARQRMIIEANGDISIPLPVPIVNRSVLSYLANSEEIADLGSKHIAYSQLFGSKEPLKGHLKNPDILILSASDYQKLKLRSLDQKDVEDAFDRCVEFVDYLVPKYADDCDYFPEVNTYLKTNLADIERLQKSPHPAKLKTTTQLLLGCATINSKNTVQQAIEIFDASYSFSKFALAMAHTGYVIAIDYGRNRKSHLLGSVTNQSMYRKYPETDASLFQNPGKVNITFEVPFDLLARSMQRKGWQTTWYGTENGLIHILEDHSPKNWLSAMANRYGQKQLNWLWGMASLGFKMLIMKSEKVQSNYSPPAVAGSLDATRSPSLNVEYSDVEGGQVDLLARLILQQVMNDLQTMGSISRSTLVQEALTFVKEQYAPDSPSPQGIISTLLRLVANGELLSVIRYRQATHMPMPIISANDTIAPLAQTYTNAFISNLQLLYSRWPKVFAPLQQHPPLHEKIITNTLETVSTKDLGSKNTNNTKALEIAAAVGNVSALNLFLEAMPDPQDYSEMINNAIIQACKWNQTNTALRLLEFCHANNINTVKGSSQGLRMALTTGNSPLANYLNNQTACKPWQEAVFSTDPSPLHLAVLQQWDPFIDSLLKNGIHPDVQEKNFQTPLHIAASMGSLNSIATLLNRGANPFKMDFSQDTPLHIAAKKGHLDTFKCLYERMKENKQIHVIANNIALYTASHGIEPILEYLLDNDLAPTQKMLEAAIRGKKENTAFLLLQRGLDPSQALPKAANIDMLLTLLAFMPHNTRPQNLRHSEVHANIQHLFECPNSLLHHCVSYQKTHLVNHLLKQGLEAHTSDDKTSPLLAALQLPNKAIQHLLIKAYKGSVAPESVVASTILLGDLSALQTLMDKGISLACAERIGYSLAFLGVISGSPTMLKFVLENSQSDVNAHGKGKDQRSPLGCAVTLKRSEEIICEIIEILHAHGAKLDNRVHPNHHHTPLLLALEDSLSKVALTLLRLGASSDESYLPIAKQNGLLECIAAIHRRLSGLGAWGWQY